MLGWLVERVRLLSTKPALRWIALLGLCSAYLQGGLAKAMNFSGAVTEMAHAGLAPALPMAIATIVL